VDGQALVLICQKPEWQGYLKSTMGIKAGPAFRLQDLVLSTIKTDSKGEDHEKLQKKEERDEKLQKSDEKGDSKNGDNSLLEFRKEDIQKGRHLGKGSFASVYSCVYSPTGQRYAAKEMLFGIYIK
jgi:hypothetical protein